MKIHKWLLLAFLGVTEAIKATGQVQLPSLPDPPQFPASRPQETVFYERGRVTDKKFWLVTGINGAAVAADAWSTISRTHYGLYGPSNPMHYCNYEQGTPWLYGSKPSAGRIAGTMSGELAASVASSWILKRKRVKLLGIPLWIAPQVYNGYGHAIGASHNLEVCQ